METFADHEFYRENGGRLTEQEYNAVAGRAYAEIVSRTQGAATNAPEEMKDLVKMCECEMIELFHSHDQAKEMLPVGISSASNDRLSVTSESGHSSGLEAGLNATCAKYLQFPVNLMCRWV